MKKLTIFLLLSLTLTKAFSQDLDSIRMEFNKLMKEYIDKNNGNTIRDIVYAISFHATIWPVDNK